MSIIPDWSLRTPDERAAIDAQMRAQNLVPSSGGVDFSNSASPDYVSPIRLWVQNPDGTVTASDGSGGSVPFGAGAVPGQALSGKPDVPAMTLSDYLTQAYYGGNNAVVGASDYLSGAVGSVSDFAQSVAGGVQSAAGTVKNLNSSLSWAPFIVIAVALLIFTSRR